MDMGEILQRIQKRGKEIGLSEQALSREDGLSKDGIRLIGNKKRLSYRFHVDGGKITA